MIHVPQSNVPSPSNANASELHQSKNNLIGSTDVAVQRPAVSTTTPLGQMDHMYNLLLNPTSSTTCSENTTSSSPRSHLDSTTLSNCPPGPALTKHTVHDTQSQGKYSDSLINGNVYSNQFASGIPGCKKNYPYLHSEYNEDLLSNAEICHTNLHQEVFSKETCEGLPSIRSHVAASPNSLSSRSSLLSCGSFSSHSPSVSSHESASSRFKTTASSCRESTEDTVLCQGNMSHDHQNISSDLCHIPNRDSLGYSLLNCAPNGVLTTTGNALVNDPRLLVSPGVTSQNVPQLTSCSNMTNVTTNPGHSMPMNPSQCAMNLYSSRNPFSLVSTPQMFGYSPSMLGHHSHHVHSHHQPLASPGASSLPNSHNIGHPQFTGLLPRLTPGSLHPSSGTSFPTHTGTSPLFTTRNPGLPCPGFHSVSGSGPRYMLDASASRLADETLPTYPNAAAAPNRLPAHKPVRLTQPKHPLAPQGTPVYFKYGEEHYPEETVPPEYTFTETDGTVCRYITNFLVYNKRGERLLPIEVLDQPRHAALVLYGSLLPADVMSQSSCRAGKRQSEAEMDHLRSGKKRSGGTNNLSALPKRHTSGGSGCLHIRDSCRGNVVTQIYPVRVELAEWCIDYGQEPSNVPFIWLISRWDVYYRLEKPAGRYIPTFATAKMKFEVSTRIIKTLQHRPDTGYKTLVNLLTAATRLEKSQNKAERRAILERERRARRTGNGVPLDTQGHNNADGINRLKNGTHDGSGTQGGTTKKKNRNWRIQSLSTPQGTGVMLTHEDGRPQAVTSWGAPYAVDGFKESMLLGLTEFLESQLRNFMDGVGSTAEGGGCADLLNTPFMRALRERTALRMEALQLMEAKRRALEVAKSLAEAASGHSIVHNLSHTSNGLEGGSSGPLIPGSAHDMASSTVSHQALDSSNFMQYTPGAPGNPSTGASNGFGIHPGDSCHYFHSIPPITPHTTTPVAHGQAPYFSGMSSVSGTPGAPGMLGTSLFQGNNNTRFMVANNGIATLESEIQHLQQLLKDSDDDDEEDEEEEGEDDEDDEEDEEDDEGRGAEHGSTKGRNREDDRDDDDRDNDEPDYENGCADGEHDETRDDSESDEAKKVVDSEETQVLPEKNATLRNRILIVNKRKAKNHDSTQIYPSHHTRETFITKQSSHLSLLKLLSSMSSLAFNSPIPYCTLKKLSSPPILTAIQNSRNLTKDESFKQISFNVYLNWTSCLFKNRKPENVNELFHLSQLQKKHCYSRHSLNSLYDHHFTFKRNQLHQCEATHQHKLTHIQSICHQHIPYVKGYHICTPTDQRKTQYRPKLNFSEKAWHQVCLLWDCGRGLLVFLFVQHL